MSQDVAYRIVAVAVNHNTSRYTELMLRSFFAMHPTGLNITFTIYDNGSQDDMEALVAYTRCKGIPLIPSGLPLDPPTGNSHGEILRRHVLDHPDCTHYLFLDADVCFLTPNTVFTMLDELKDTANTFGIMPRQSADGVNEIPFEYRTIYTSRLHPCCALVKNTPVFRQVAEIIGFSCVNYLWAKHEEYLDTFQLMTRAMQTHNLDYRISSRLVLHFFSVSWDTQPDVVQSKAAHCEQRLALLRPLDPS